MAAWKMYLFTNLAILMFPPVMTQDLKYKLTNSAIFGHTWSSCGTSQSKLHCAKLCHQRAGNKGFTYRPDSQYCCCVEVSSDPDDLIHPTSSKKHYVSESIGLGGRTEIYCTGESFTLKCEPPLRVRVYHAWYGRRSDSVCGTDVSTCDANPNKTDITTLRQMCDQRTNCTSTVSGDVFGNLCPGVTKYLVVHYSCVAAAYSVSQVHTLNESDVISRLNITQESCVVECEITADCKKFLFSENEGCVLMRQWSPGGNNVTGAALYTGGAGFVIRDGQCPALTLEELHVTAAECARRCLVEHRLLCKSFSYTYKNDSAVNCWIRADKCKMSLDISQGVATYRKSTRLHHLMYRSGSYVVSERDAVCSQIQAHTATLQEMTSSWERGYARCQCGWTADEEPRFSMTFSAAGCLGPNVNVCDWISPSSVLAVYCYRENE